MKSDVEIYTMALVRVIHESRECKEYEDVKKRVAKEPEVKKQIDQYRKTTYDLQNFVDKDKIYEETEKSYELSRELRENPLVEEYLACELAVCRMMQKIVSRVVDSVDLELDDIQITLPSTGEKTS